MHEFRELGMTIFFLRRLLTLAATLIGASLIIFLVLDALPGNAAQMLMGADASADAVRARTRIIAGCAAIASA
jgi:peptide/nickel transport system permease protein